MRFLKKLFRIREPEHVTFGGQRVMNLLDDKRIEEVIAQEPSFAEQRKKEILWKLGASEQDVRECIAFKWVADPQGNEMLCGMVRGCKITIRYVIGGCYLLMNEEEIDDDVPTKQMVINFVNQVRNAVERERDSLKELGNSVRVAKRKFEQAQMKQEKIVSDSKRISTFFQNTP